jgi:hypothetical protein
METDMANVDNKSLEIYVSPQAGFSKAGDGLAAKAKDAFCDFLPLNFDSNGTV